MSTTTFLLAASGAVLVVLTNLPNGLNFGVLLFTAWGLVPYALVFMVGRVVRNRWVNAGVGLAALAVDIGIRLSVFVFPRGSTAAIALLYSPVFIAAIAMPAGGFAGWLVSRTPSRRPVVRAAAVSGFAAALLLTVVGFGRPDLFPTTVVFREWSRNRIGAARLLAGGDTFEKVVVTDRATFRLAGEFDGEPGDELAVVDFEGVQLFTPATLAERLRLDLGGEIRTRWGPSSVLARAQGDLVIVDTGGGFQDTAVRDLDGTERWRYRPDADLPPTSLVPADLDGDGVEFYATINSFLVRLDVSGQEVWRAPLRRGSIAATAPRTQRDPGWIVADSQGRMVVVDERGGRVAGVTMKDARPVSVLEWPDGRVVLTAGSAARAVRPDGTVAFEWEVPDMTVDDARPVSLDGGPAAVALVAAGPRGTNRWRVQIVTRERELLYDEIVDTPPRLITARGADGVDRLFLSGDSLIALRRRS